MTDAGILLGLPRQVAHDLIVQTAIGSAIMLRDSGEHPVKLREAVTSPAGTPINAIPEVEKHRGRGGLLAALEGAPGPGPPIARQPRGLPGIQWRAPGTPPRRAGTVSARPPP